jgi:hypothetical protein
LSDTQDAFSIFFLIILLAYVSVFSDSVGDFRQEIANTTAASMTRYAIQYTRIPTHYNDSRVADVEAESPQNALELLQHRLGDHSGVRNHVYADSKEYLPPASKGRIVTLNEFGEL